MSTLRRSLYSLVLIAAVVVAAARPPVPASATRSGPRAGGLSDTSSQVFLPVVARPREPIGIITTPAELLATKALADQGVEPSRSAVITLLRAANKALALPPCATTIYSTATGGECLNQSAQYAFALALAYRVTGDPRYDSQAAAIIRTWSATLAAINTVGDTQAELDWSRMAPAMIWAADLLEGTPAWADGDRQQFAAMLVGKVLPVGKQITERDNNWSDAGNLVWLAIAIYADLPAERAAAQASWRLKLDGVLQPNGTWASGMDVDGSLPEENRRGLDGLAYNQGALSLKTVFAEMMRRQGDASLYTYTTPRGVGLKNGWDFLARYVVSARSAICDWPYTIDHCVDYSNKSGWEIAYARWREPAYLGPIGLERPYRWSDAADPSYSTLLFANLDISQP